MKTSQEKDTVTISKEAYKALVQSAKVSAEFLSGQVKKFKHPSELIEDLKKNDRSKQNTSL